ncbi:MAG: glycoside hydrolase family 31 protein [Bacteroidota bacterium]
MSPLSAKNFLLEESTDYLRISTAAYQVDISRQEFSFILRRSGKELLQTAPSQAFYVEQGGVKYFPDRLLAFKDAGDSLFLEYAVRPAGESIRIKMYFAEKHFMLQLTNGMTAAKLGASFLLRADEHWFGGNVTSAQNWPSSSASFEVDPFYATSNQASPLWLCSTGTAVLADTYHTMAYSFNKNGSGLFSLHIKNTVEGQLVFTVGSDLREAFISATDIFGKPGSVPVKEYFSRAIFNSWIQFRKDVNQPGLLAYAAAIREHELPCSILEVDDMWTPAYGDFTFDSRKFPDPEAMIGTLDSLGFKVVLWVTPFVEKSSSSYSFLRSRGYLIGEGKGKTPYLTEWWNGTAALIDLSNPDAYNWFLAQLKELQERYGVSGFKLDAGDAEYLAGPYTSYGNITPSEYTDLFASIGQYFAINELRVSWRTQSLGLVQRLRDKSSDWSADRGLGSLIPHGMTEGLIGYPFFCPDMIGGGEMGSFEENRGLIDPELFIRWTEASAFMPMMQYSFAPWRVDSLALELSLKYTRLHESLGDYIYSLAEGSVKTGDPIVTPLFYYFPGDPECWTIADQFMLGKRFLVAPVLKKGRCSRDVYLPEGTWVDFWNGDLIRGGQTLRAYPAPLEKLPVFINITD